MAARIQQSVLNLFYYVAGIMFLMLAKIKYDLQGYKTPKPFSIDETQRAVDYDIEVVDNWLSILREYRPDSGNPLVNSRVLELGPGSDLGVGLYLLAKGVAHYHTIDVNDLVSSAPDSFYDVLIERIHELDPSVDADYLRNQLSLTQNGDNDRLNFLCRSDFDVNTALAGAQVDYVFSQASFEHFDNLDHTVKGLSDVAQPGTVIIAEIDLQTHSRWIRQKDPNNIYRYGQTLYNLLTFKSSPNRVRPEKYKTVFEQHGWGDVVIKPLTTLPNIENEKIRDSLHDDFRGESSQMSYLTIALCGTKLP